ncbi:hypothetical protein C8Q76DRAFT_145785 [Earliella scabrosa]|nr:hypothetical protein C8Q76DRAFT_145785 [Earliella scabrosa]
MVHVWAAEGVGGAVSLPSSPFLLCLLALSDGHGGGRARTFMAHDRWSTATPSPNFPFSDVFPVVGSCRRTPQALRTHVSGLRPQTAGPRHTLTPDPSLSFLAEALTVSTNTPASYVNCQTWAPFGLVALGGSSNPLALPRHLCPPSTVCHLVICLAGLLHHPTCLLARRIECPGAEYQYVQQASGPHARQNNTCASGRCVSPHCSRMPSGAGVTFSPPAGTHLIHP